MDIFSGNISNGHTRRKFKKYMPKERYIMSEENTWDKNKEKERQRDREIDRQRK